MRNLDLFQQSQAAVDYSQFALVAVRFAIVTADGSEITETQFWTVFACFINALSALRLNIHILNILIITMPLPSAGAARVT